MANDLTNVKKALTFDIFAIGAAFPRNGSKVFEHEPFRIDDEPGRLESVLTTVTDSKVFKLYKVERSIDETVELTRHGLAEETTAAEVEDFMRGVLSAPVLELSSPDAKPAIVREIAALGTRVAVARVAMLASFEGKQLGRSGQLRVSDATVVSPPSSPVAGVLGERQVHDVAIVAAAPLPAGNPSAGATTNTAPAGHTSALTGATLPSAAGLPGAKPPRSKALSAAVLCTRLAAAPGEASTLEIQSALAHLKKQHNDYINKHVEDIIPVGVDGYGPLRPNKDIGLAVQTGNGAGPDKQPRPPLTAVDKERGQLLPTCYAVASGRVSKSILVKGTSYNMLLHGRVHKHLKAKMYAVTEDCTGSIKNPPAVSRLVRKRATDRFRQTYDMFQRAKNTGGEQGMAAAIAKSRATAAESLEQWDTLRPDLEAINSVLKRHKYKYSADLEQDLEREVENKDLWLEALLGLLEDDSWASSVRLLMTHGVEVHQLASDLYGRGAPPSGNGTAATAQPSNGAPAAPTGAAEAGSGGQQQALGNQGGQAPGATAGAVPEAAMAGQPDAPVTGKPPKRAKRGPAPVQLTDAELDFMTTGRKQGNGGKGRKQAKGGRGRK